MKKISVLLLVLIMSCSSDPEQEYRAELFETEMGLREVYGVRLHLGNDSRNKEHKGYSVSLYQDEKVWLDTVYAELIPGDSTEAEVIFYDAIVEDGSDVNYRIESFDAQ